MNIVIKHPQKGFYHTNEIWYPASRAFKYATRFDSISQAERVAITLTSILTGKPLQKLRIMDIGVHHGPISVILTEKLLKQL